MAAAAAIFAFPSVATAEYLIPPGNSAVNQYTESVPTAGGQKDLNKGQKGSNPSPNEVLGEDNTRRLESHGPQGRKAAEVAAVTAPDGSVQASQDEGEEGAAVTGGGGDGGAGTAGQGGGTAGSVTAPQDSDGSSGLGEVLGQATGSSSGQLGLLLPLVIIATGAWACAFFWRQRVRRTS